MPPFPSTVQSLNLALPNTEMTEPRVTSDLLMLAPSFNLCPVAPDASALSLLRQ